MWGWLVVVAVGGACFPLHRGGPSARPAWEWRIDSLRPISPPATIARAIGEWDGLPQPNQGIAADLNGEVVESDQVKIRDLPPALQEMMLQMQVGQATRPFGSVEDGVRVLVLCGRDEVDPSAPSFDQVYAQLNEERVNTRSRRYLRDLRRDAVIDYR